MTHVQLAVELQVSQPTITRHLRSLGYSRGPDGRLRPAKQEESGRHRRRHVPVSAGFLAGYIDRIELVDQFAVVKTIDGAGPALTAHLDEADLPWIVGTIGGRDTILVILRGSQEQVANRAFPSLTEYLLGE